MTSPPPLTVLALISGNSPSTSASCVFVFVLFFAREIFESCRKNIRLVTALIASALFGTGASNTSSLGLMEGTWMSGITG